MAWSLVFAGLDVHRVLVMTAADATVVACRRGARKLVNRVATPFPALEMHSGEIGPRWSSIAGLPDTGLPRNLLNCPPL